MKTISRYIKPNDTFKINDIKVEVKKLNHAYVAMKEKFPDRSWSMKHDSEMLQFVDIWAKELRKGKWSRLFSRIFS